MELIIILNDNIKQTLMNANNIYNKDSCKKNCLIQMLRSVELNILPKYYVFTL